MLKVLKMAVAVVAAPVMVWFLIPVLVCLGVLVLLAVPIAGAKALRNHLQGGTLTVDAISWTFVDEVEREADLAA
jgi:hypothetical protein